MFPSLTFAITFSMVSINIVINVAITATICQSRCHPQRHRQCHQCHRHSHLPSSSSSSIAIVNVTHADIRPRTIVFSMIVINVTCLLAISTTLAINVFSELVYNVQCTMYNVYLSFFESWTYHLTLFQRLLSLFSSMSPFISLSSFHLHICLLTTNQFIKSEMISFQNC